MVRRAYFVLPIGRGGGFAGLQASANALLDKVNTIPFDQIGKDLTASLQSVTRLPAGRKCSEH